MTITILNRGSTALSYSKRVIFFLAIFCALSLLLQGDLFAAGRLRKSKSVLTGKEVPQSIIRFTAKDSVIYHFDRRSMELWGKATISQEAMSVRAPRIVVDLESSKLHAHSAPASMNRPAESVFFTDRQESFLAESMMYNFITRRGESTCITSSSGALTLSGEQVSTLENGTLVARDGVITTCNEPDPHYWFSSPSLMLDTASTVTARPLFMYIRPEIFSLRLPALPIFALPPLSFSLKPERMSGFLMPGLTTLAGSTALSNLGYYWAIDDYRDLRSEGDIAVNGSWRLGERFRYVKRNSFSGEIAAETKSFFQDSSEKRVTEWNMNIVHNQVFDTSARLDAHLQLQGGERSSDLYSMNTETLLREQANSRVSLSKTFNDDNGIAMVSYNRSADLRNIREQQSAGAALYQNRAYPFRSAFSADQQQWRDAVSVTSAASFVGESLSAPLSSSSGHTIHAFGEVGYYHEFSDGYQSFFTQGIHFQNTQSVPGLHNEPYRGMRVLFPLRMQSTLFHYLHINPSLTWSHVPRSEYDDRSFATTVFSVDATTRLYGTIETGFLENMIGLSSLRHTFIPVVSYTWNQPFSAVGYDFTVHTLYDWPNSMVNGGFAPTVFSGIPSGQSTVALTLKNLFHGKFRGSSSSGDGGLSEADQSVQLLSISASTAYNGAADTFRLAPLTLLASSNVLAENLLLSAGSMYDFYGYNSVTGGRVNRYNSQDGKPPLRFVKGFLNMSLGIQSGAQPQASASTFAQPFVYNTGQQLFSEPFSSLDWQLRFSLFLQTDKSNPSETTYEKLINVAGKVALSKKWQIAVNTGYDFESKQFAFPVVQLYRDMHCWQMGFQWVPSGVFHGYAFQLGLKTL